MLSAPQMTAQIPGFTWRHSAAARWLPVSRKVEAIDGKTARRSIENSLHWSLGMDSQFCGTLFFYGSITLAGTRDAATPARLPRFLNVLDALIPTHHPIYVKR